MLMPYMVFFMRKYVNACLDMGRGVDHPPPSKRRRHERVGLYLYSPSGPRWPAIGRTLPYFKCLDIHGS